MNLLLLILFFLSGLAALVYEVVWLHLLRLSIGVSTHSLIVILSIFMGGMALGSLLAGRIVARGRRPLKVYAVLEVGIGLLGIIVPTLLSTSKAVYISTYSWHEGSVLVRALMASLILLPPTALMGATLPILSRWLERDRRGAGQVGRLYSANIFGAVAGSLLAGVVLMQYFDTRVASLAAAVINFLVGFISWRVAIGRPIEHTLAPMYSEKTHRPSQHGSKLTIPAVVLFLSGFAALGAEVIWTRLLTLSLGPTVYTFALVLAVFLMGLGIGSSVSASLLQRAVNPLLALGACQLALVVLIPIAASSFSDRGLMPRSFWLLSFAADWPATLHDLVRCLVTVFPAALLWGASFPFAVAIVFRGEGEQARDIGFLSAANTLGAIAGAVAAALVLIPWCGTQIAQQTLVAASAIAACCCLLGYLKNRESGTQRRRRMAIGTAAFIAIAAVGVINVLPPSPALFAYGREAAQRRRDAPYEVVREGVHSPIVVTHWPQHGNIRALHLAGKLEASDDKIDLRLERMLGHIPQFLSRDPQSVLVVGLGAGITAGSFVMDDRLQSLTICELEPALPPITAEYFALANHNVLFDPRTKLIIDDGRHYLQTTQRKFDVISVDPIHPWVRGAAALYSKEFFQECRDHLQPGGVVSYWVPMHSMTVESVKSEIATFFKVFPYVMVWHTGGTIIQRHMLLVGSNEPFVLDLDNVDRIAGPDSKIEQSIHEMEFASVDDMLSLYVADRDALRAWVEGAEINSDMSLKLEYMAGAAAYQNNREEIFRDITAHRIWQSGIFRGDDARLDAIRKNLGKFDALEDAAPKRPYPAVSR